MHNALYKIGTYPLNQCLNLTLCLIITTIVVFNKFHLPITSLLLGMKRVFKHKEFKKNITNMSNFHSL